MHFVGMGAVTLEETPICYNWFITVLSLLVAVLFMWGGIRVARNDCFQGPDRVTVLKGMISKHPEITTKGHHKRANRIIHRVAFFHGLAPILLGATLAATGALTMHYSGMAAQRGSFTMQWSLVYVAASVVLGVVVCIVGFWILFRLLLWKVEQAWLRPASAAVIAGAVCSLHFFGMLSVTYIQNDLDVGSCEGQQLRPGQWNTHQLLAFSVALIVPSLALFVENLINRELLLAYSSLKNPSLTVDDIISVAARSNDPNVRRAADMVRAGSHERLDIPPIAVSESDDTKDPLGKVLTSEVSLLSIAAEEMP